MDTAMPSTSSDGAERLMHEPKEGTDEEDWTDQESIEEDDTPEDTMAKKPYIDPDLARRLLECPVCLQLPSGHIYTCWENHPICKRCFDTLQSDGNLRCPVGLCQYPTSPFRMRSTEQMIEQYGFELPCAYETHGCKIKCPKSELPTHAKQCGYRMIECLQSKSMVSRNQMAAHYQKEHHDLILPSNVTHFYFTLNYNKDKFLYSWRQRLMMVVLGSDSLPIYSFMAVNNKVAILAAMADLEDPRFQGVDCRIELKMPGSKGGTHIYQGPLYDLETSFDMLLGSGDGLCIPTDFIKKNRNDWPDKTLHAEFNLIQKL